MDKRMQASTCQSVKVSDNTTLIDTADVLETLHRHLREGTITHICKR